ncbi:unnamed protein product, partial [Didymodactylos carnosus]
NEKSKHFDVDYKTIADVLIQEVVKYDLKQLYPTLEERIYGEEDGSIQIQDEKFRIDVSGSIEQTLELLQKLFKIKCETMNDLAKLISCKNIATIPKLSFDKIPETTTIDLINVGVWIDPIDGTHQYISGVDGLICPITGINIDGLPTAMVLIGIFDVSTGEAIIGIVNKVFHQKLSDNSWQGLVYWGTSYQKKNYNNISEVHQQLTNKEPQKRTIIYGTVNNHSFTNLFNDWNKIDVAACGNKLMCVALKQANIYILTKSSAFFWDLCAPHAIIKSMNGQVIDLQKAVDQYELLKTSTTQSVLNMTDVDWLKYQLVYNKILSKKFKPTECLIVPFIAYSNIKDLQDTLEILAKNKNLIQPEEEK